MRSGRKWRCAVCSSSRRWRGWRVRWKRRRGLGAELQAPPLERVERAERLPLSFAQQRLWFLDQLEPEQFVLQHSGGGAVEGALNVEALERTLSEVVRRHEVLRTHFIAVDGEPVQVIEAAGAAASWK